MPRMVGRSAGFDRTARSRFGQSFEYVSNADARSGDSEVQQQGDNNIKKL